MKLSDVSFCDGFRTPATHTRRASHRLGRPAFENHHNNGLMRRSEQPIHSITSSARPSSGSGTVSPSACPLGNR
jgi:hypothetical protein